MIVSTDRRLTLDEYLDYDDGTDVRYELEDGVLVEMGAESELNPWIAMFLLGELLKQGIPLQQMIIGHQIAVSSTKATSRQPDLIVHSEGSKAAIRQDGKVLRPYAPPPLLVLEVVSSSKTDWKSKNRDYVLKRDEYEARGIPEYWLADPIAELIIVFSLVDGVYHAAEFRGTQLIVSTGFPSLKLTAERLLSADFED
jgi:Uma2 family endonuclease